MITEEKLIKKHYILQVERINLSKPIRQFYPFEGFGIECGEGWYNILDKLCTKIESYLDKNLEEKKAFKILQIKQKFGGLRFYTSFSCAEIQKYIGIAEKESYKTCEVCGEPGEYNVLGFYILTLCKKCIENRKKSFMGK